MSVRPWTEDELKRARDLYAAGYFYGEIDKLLRCPADSTKRWLKESGHNVKSNRVPNQLLAERDALIAARNQRALRQDFFGDPPPGYSAFRFRRFWNGQWIFLNDWHGSTAWAWVWIAPGVRAWRPINVRIGYSGKQVVIPSPASRAILR
jgi:hypothetical protein